MNKYLLEILKEANTIIIPGLGALTITNKEKNEIMFMPYLKHDDGKLSSYISEKDGIDETEAKNIVAKFVREIQASLDKGESYDMFQFGTFSKVAGDIEFQSWKADEVAEKAPIPVVVPVENKEVKAEVPQEKKETPPPIKKVEEPKTKAEEPVKPKEEPIKEKPPVVVEKKETPVPVKEEKVEKQPLPPIKPMNIIEKEELSKNVDKLDDLKQKSDTEKTVKKAVFTPINTAPKEITPKTETLRKDTKKVVKETKEKEEKKRGIGFWIFSILLVALIAGGTYFGMNYNSLKQHIPFLADKVENDKPIVSELDKMKGLLGDDQTEASENQIDDQEEGQEDQAEENVTEQDETNADSEETASEESADEENQEEIIETPEKVETTPSPQVTGSSTGAYKVIAGVFSSEENAQRLVEKFKGQGLPASTFENFNGMYVVCMKAFDSSEEANAEMGSLRAISSGAWVMYRP